MSNKLIPVDEFVKELKKSIDDSGLNDEYKNASKRDKELILYLLCNMFGGKMPLDKFRNKHEH